MTTYDNRNTGIIAKNPRKNSDKHPDITGSLNVEGVEYFVDGWQKQRKDGSGSFYSLRLKRKDKQPSTSRPASGSALPLDDSDMIPFAPEWR